MLTPKQNLFETMRKNGNPDRWVNQYEPFSIIKNDPLLRYTRGDRKPGSVVKDAWGTTIVWVAGQSAATPHITQENMVLPDITEWRDHIKIPDLRATCSHGWEDALAARDMIDKEQYLVTGLMTTGLFEQSHYLMGFEDALANLLLEPDDMHDLLNAILDYKLTYARMLIENLHPDAILSHDDWGSKTNLFMNPETWREFYKPLYKKLYGYIKAEGVMIVHHSDSYCEDIVEDMVDLGIDIWQGVLPQNDIRKLLPQLDGRMALMGGIDMALIDREDVTAEEIRAEVRRACMEYGFCPHFIPSITYGGPTDNVYPNVDVIMTDEIERCNKTLFCSIKNCG